MRTTNSRTTLQRLLVAGMCGAVALAAVPGGAADEPQVSYDGLHRIEGSILDEAWVRPDIDLGGYKSVIVAPVSVSYQRTPQSTRRRGASTGRDNFALTDSQMENVKEILQTAFVDAMSEGDGWNVVEESGPDVLRVTASLIDLVVTVPTQQGTGRSEFFITEFGQVSLVGELHDSQSGEIIARVVDRRVIGRSAGGRAFRATSVRARRDVSQLFGGWAELIRQRLDQIRDISTPAESAPEDS